MTKDNKNKISTIVLCAGGSGGHIFPAESLGTELQKKGFNIILLTDKRGQAFKGKDFSVHRVSGEAVTGRGFIRKIIALAKLGLGTLQAYIFFKKVKPVIVIGFGGFASIPGAAAAVLSRIPLVIHEQNAVLGRANRLMAKKASLIITSFAETSMLPQGVRVKHGGMPIRPEVAAKAGAPYPKLDAASPINILVIGGSQGASILSRVLPDAFKLLPDSLKKRIKLSVNATGRKKSASVKIRYAEKHLADLQVTDFIHNLVGGHSCCHTGTHNRACGTARNTLGFNACFLQRFYKTDVCHTSGTA